MTPLLTLFAQGDAQQASTPPWFYLLYALPVLMLIMLFRSNSRQKREQQNALANLKKNDKVVTASGILGVVVSIKDNEDEVTLRECVVDVRRPAPARRFPQHSDAVAVRVPPVAAQRVLPRQPVREQQVDVGPRGPVREAPPVGVTQGQCDNTVRDKLFGDNSQRRVRWRTGTNRVLWHLDSSISRLFEDLPSRG